MPWGPRRHGRTGCRKQKTPCETSGEPNQPTGAAQPKNRRSEGHSLDGLHLQPPRYPHGDTTVPPTRLVGSTMERHEHNGHRPHIHTRNKDSDPTGTRRPFATLRSPHQPPQGALISPENRDALDSRCPSQRHNATRNVAHSHSQPGSLHTKTRDGKGGTLDVLAHRHRTNPQTSHHQPTRTREPTSRYAPTTRGARTGIQHLSKPQRAEAGPQTCTRTTPAQAQASSRRSGHLGPPGQTAQAGAESGPGATTA